MPLTEEQALKQAQELIGSFSSNELMGTRLNILGRDLNIPWESLGLQENIKNILPWQTERPNQAGHRFADLLSLPHPVAEVFVASDQPIKQKEGQLWESAYQGMIDTLMADDYDVCRDMASISLGVRRLDIKGEFFKGSPEQEENEEAAVFNIRAAEHRQQFGLPFELVTVKPKDFYYREDRKRENVIFAVELVKVMESEVKEDGDSGLPGTLMIVRSPEHIWHWFQEEGVGSNQSTSTMPSEPALVQDFENPFGHTGYFLYRGRYTGHSDLQRVYDPFILPTLNMAQQLSILITMSLNFGVQAGTHWIEHDLPRMIDAGSRAVAAAMKATRSGVVTRTEAGQPASDMEPGAHVRFRELAQDYKEAAAMLIQEDEKYAPPDVLFGEESHGDSGRNVIRRQEAAGHLLAVGLRSRRLTIESILRVIRKTLFSQAEYLSEGRQVFIPNMITEPGAHGDVRKQDIIGVGAENNVIHEINVSVEATSQAGQLALNDEGRAMEGQISWETRATSYFNVRDTGLEKKRLIRERMRTAGEPLVINDGLNQALDALAKRPVSQPSVVGTEPEAGGDTPGASGGPGASGAATPSQPEDAGVSLRGNGAGQL